MPATCRYNMACQGNFKFDPLMSYKMRFIFGFAVVFIFQTILGKAGEVCPKGKLCCLCNCNAEHKKIKWIDCTHRKLSTIPALTYNTSGRLLERLDLSFNKISTIRNGSFIEATALKILLLGNNQIEEISESLFNNLPLLEKLTLINNKIKMLPERLFYKTRNIKEIVLRANFISDIPHGLFQHSHKLSKLDFDQNNIARIPPRLFSKTVQLEWLDMSKNMITMIPKGLFDNTPRLLYLDLKENGLSTIDSTLFKNTLNLSLLNIGRNRIEKLPYGLLTYTKDLKKLNIGSNRIARLRPELFSCTKELVDLTIFNNSFRTVTPKLFENIPKLIKLTTSGFTDCCNAKRVTGNEITCFYNENRKLDYQGCGVHLSHNGTVGIYDYENTKWKVLCYKNWTKTDADVLCRDLNFVEALNTFPLAKNNYSKILPKCYMCKGNESYLMDCSTRKDENCKCNIPGALVGVRCKIDGEIVENVCNVSNDTVDCTERDLQFMPWVNETALPSHKYTNISRFNVSGNKIVTIWKGNLASFTSVRTLDCSHNIIKKIPVDYFFHSRKLQNLNFSNNQINVFSLNIFVNLPNLVYLDLSKNQLTVFPVDEEQRNDSLDNFKNLETLDLSRNKISELSAGFFMNKDNKLKNLNLSGNLLKMLPEDKMEYLKSLEVLDISDMPTLIIQNWKSLHSLNVLKASKFDQCCYAVRAISSLNCEAPEDDFSNCESMIKDTRLVVILWIVMVTVIVGNVLAFFIRLLIPSNKNASKLFILNLTVSDFLMGVFLSGIIQKYRSLENEYYRYDREWRTSNSCKALGAIALLSSEVSLGTLAAIAYTRYRSVIQGISGTKVNFRLASITVLGIWAFGFCVSLTPVFVKSYFYDEETGSGFYGENAFCLPLQLPGERQTGWEYCFIIFACINLFVLCYVVYIYGYMLCQLFFTSTNRVSTESYEDTFVTIRISLVILTDIFCWIPVIILLLLSLAGMVNDQEKEIYSWFVVAVFPINSAINPMIYTIFAPGIWKRTREALQSICERIGGSQDHGFGSNSTQLTRTSDRSTHAIELVGTPHKI